MDASALEGVYEGLQDFHAYFAPVFGRKQLRERGGQYLQGLLVQSGERRNAENLSEAVPASPRALQRFLTESPWDDDRVIGRLQEYLCPRLEHPEAVWVLDGSDFPKQGRKSVGVARQYCGALGKIANCQAGLFLAHVGPRGRVLVDKRLYLPEEWTGDVETVQDGRSAGGEAGVPRQDGLGLGDAGAGPGQRTSGGAVGGRRLGFRDVAHAAGGSDGGGDVVRAERATGHDGVASGTRLDQPAVSGQRTSPQTETAQRGASHRRGAQSGAAGGSLAGDNGGPGRSYRFSAQRVRPTSRRKPGEILWAICRRNLDGSEPRYYLSNAPEETPLETLAYVGGSRWRIETEFETEKSDVGLDEYETRTWAGWHHHITMCLLAGAFLLTLQQD